MAKPRKQVTKAEREALRLGHLIQETMNTRGWKEIIEPLWDEAVAGVVGRKSPSGLRLKGSFVKSRKEERMIWFNGYLCCAEDLWNSIQAFVTTAKSVEAQIKEREEHDESKDVIIPMVEDENETEED